MEKLDIFSDKKYENMEWIEQVIAPFVFPFNGYLALIPQSYDLTFQDVMLLTKNLSERVVSTISVLKFLDRKLELRLPKDFYESYPRYSDDEDLFKITVSKDCKIVIDDKVLHGKITFSKEVDQLDGAQLHNIMARSFSSAIGWIDKNETDISRLNEVMDVFDLKDNRSSKSVRYKFQEIKNFMETSIRNDKWRIRDVDLATKLGKWLHEYITRGNLASFNNVIRFKCMTHFQQPIYSIQETK